VTVAFLLAIAGAVGMLLGDPAPPSAPSSVRPTRIVVREDVDGDGTVGDADPIAAGVVVTDGTRVTRSGPDGVVELPPDWGAWTVVSGSSTHAPGGRMIWRSDGMPSALPVVRWNRELLRFAFFTDPPYPFTRGAERVYASMFRSIADTAPKFDLVVQGGDCWEADFSRCEAEVEKQAGWYLERRAQARLPVVDCVGNHELPLRMPPTSPWSGDPYAAFEKFVGPRRWALRFGRTHLICLDLYRAVGGQAAEEFPAELEQWLLRYAATMGEGDRSVVVSPYNPSRVGKAGDDRFRALGAALQAVHAVGTIVGDAHARYRRPAGTLPPTEVVTAMVGQKYPQSTDQRGVRRGWASCTVSQSGLEVCFRDADLPARIDANFCAGRPHRIEATVYSDRLVTAVRTRPRDGSLAWLEMRVASPEDDPMRWSCDLPANTPEGDWEVAAESDGSPCAVGVCRVRAAGSEELWSLRDWGGDLKRAIPMVDGDSETVRCTASGDAVDVAAAGDPGRVQALCFRRDAWSIHSPIELQAELQSTSGRLGVGAWFRAKSGGKVEWAVSLTTSPSGRVAMVSHDRWGFATGVVGVHEGSPRAVLRLEIGNGEVVGRCGDAVVGHVAIGTALESLPGIFACAQIDGRACRGSIFSAHLRLAAPAVGRPADATVPVLVEREPVEPADAGAVIAFDRGETLVINIPERQRRQGQILAQCSPDAVLCVREDTLDLPEIRKQLAFLPPQACRVEIWRSGGAWFVRIERTVSSLADTESARECFLTYRDELPWTILPIARSKSVPRGIGRLADDFVSDLIPRGVR
jgi:hypothetical protein